MNKTTKTILITLGVALALFLFWYFRYLVACFLIAIIVSAIGQPLKALLDKIHIKGKKLGNTLTSIVTLVLIVGVLFGLFFLFIPLIASQAASFFQIDFTKIISYYQEPIAQFEQILVNYGLLGEGISLEKYLNNQVMHFLSSIDYQPLISNLISFAGNFFMGIFIVLFVVFFLLKDPSLLPNIVYVLTPDRRMEEIKHIIKTSRNLISRYFLGLCCEILSVSILLSIGFSIVGIPNAFFIAFFCGILVIVPYLGSFIGAIIGLLITLASILSVDPSVSILFILLKFFGVFIAVKGIDDFFLQPLIYSKSVKAHPLEIFFVILIAGEIGGIVGMIVAIPTYTLLRIIAKEFFANSKLVKSLTKDI